MKNPRLAAPSAMRLSPIAKAGKLPRKPRAGGGRKRAATKEAGSASANGSHVEDAIYEKLLTAIFEHRLPPGTKLGEDRLAKIFAVSRARIRSVLPRLAHDGVVHLQPNRGAFVAQPSVKEAREVFEMRRVLEPAIVRKLAHELDKAADLAPLRQHVAEETRARNNGEMRTVVRLSGEFHILLAERTGNEMLARSMRELASLTCLIIALYDKPSVPSCLGAEHRDIVDALAVRDGDRAAQLMLDHLGHVEHNLDLSLPDVGPVDLEEALF